MLEVLKERAKKIEAAGIELKEAKKDLAKAESAGFDIETEYYRHVREEM